MLFAITDITVYKWTLEWIERMGSRSINNLLVITKNARWIMLHSIIQNISKKKKKEKEEEFFSRIDRANYHLQSAISIARRTRTPSLHQVFHVSSPLPLPSVAQTWKVDGPRGKKNN